MTTIAMEKDGTLIRVDSSLRAAHEQIGWTVASVANDLSNVDLVVGAEDTDVINVALQLQDAAGAALSESVSLIAFLSDDTDGVDQTATAPDGHVAAGTNGGCVHLVTDKFFLLNTDSSGRVDLNIEEAGTATWYLVLVFPNGERVISGAITFAA